MRSRWLACGRVGCALALMLVGADFSRAAPAGTDETVAPVIWRLAKAGAIAGLAPTVWGAPQPIAARDGGTLHFARDGGALHFNGTSDGVLLPVNPLEHHAAFTIEILFQPDEDGGAAQRFLHVQDAAGARALMEIRLDGRGHWWLDTFLRTNDPGKALIDPKQIHATNQWHWAALRYDGTTMSHYVDGVKEMEAPVAFAPMGDGQVSLGVRQNKVYWFKGAIAEVRFYSTALASEKLQRIKE